MSEQRRLAEIEKHLCAEDPRLARMIADWPAGRPGRRGSVLGAGAAGAIAAILIGAALLGSPGGSVLIALATLSLLAAFVLAIWRPPSNRRPPQRPDAKPRSEARPRHGAGPWYLWCYPWWWG